MKAKANLLICSIICLSVLFNKANSQKVSVTDTAKLLCQKWIVISRTINGKQYPIIEKSISDNKARSKPGIDTTTYYQFNEDKTFNSGGIFGSINAHWQYISSSRSVELIDNYGKSAFKLVKIDRIHLTLDTGHGVMVNYKALK